MCNINQLLKYLLLCCFFFLLGAQPSFAKADKYDIAYIWDRDLEKVLDYKERLDELFPQDIRMRIIVVGKGKEYGAVFDRNGSARSVKYDMVLQSEVLRQAGLGEPHIVKDEGYYRLYNVSYGIGPNLDVLKKKYNRVYNHLGKGVGKDLIIEQISEHNYSLVYRRRGDRRSTAVVARNHAKVLRKKKISATIISENNNPVVFGESSLLDEEEPPVKKVITVAGNIPDLTSKKDRIPGPSSIPILSGLSKKKVADVSAPRTPAVIKSVAVAGGSGNFEASVERLIKKLRKKGAIAADERTGWVVYDLENDKTLVDINANFSFQAASMIKPLVALAFFHQVKQGIFAYGPKSRRKMEAMIQRSNNDATNWVMRQAGGPAKVNRILRDNYSHIFKQTRIVEYIPAGGRTYKNSSQPSDYVRFLRAMWNKELPYGKELRRLMALPGRDRLYHGTPIPQGTLVYNKTGSTAHLCGDMGILAPREKSGGRYPYAIVGIIERESRPANYGSWIGSRSRVIRQVSTLVYKELKKSQQLL